MVSKRCAQGYEVTGDLEGTYALSWAMNIPYINWSGSLLDNVVCNILAQTGFDLLWGFKLKLLAAVARGCARWRVSSCCLPICLSLVEVLNYALVVPVDYFVRDSFHAKNFNIQALPIRESIFNHRERLFVDLVHMD